MKKNICIITAVFAILCMGISVQAETEIIRITDNGYEDILPAVHGNTIVWQGRYNGERDIFVYDIVTKQTDPITDNDYPDIAPQTDGRYVVWLGMNNSGGNIFYYDTDPTGSGLPTQVTTDNGIITLKSPPRIADGRIVWAAQVLANSVLPGEIELYDIETGTTTTISAPADPNGSLDDHTPLIDSTKVVWVQASPDNIESTVFVHDLTSGNTYPVPDNSAIVQSSTQDGNLSITTKFDGHDKEIFLSHQRLRKNMQVTDNDVEEKNPKIHGNHLVWVSGQGAEQEVYLGITRLLSTITPGDGFVLSENSHPVFEWEAIGFDRFRVQFSSTKDFSGGETFTFPPDSDPEPWLYETSFTVEDESLAQWLNEISGSLYWRIVAQDQYGNETTSQPRIVVIKDNNYCPEITDFSTTIEPVALGSSITATAVFVDDNPGDEHTVSLDWGDGSVNEYLLEIGARNIAGNHTYADPGVYTVTMSVSDGSCEAAVYEYNYIVIYDPEGGFVTGGGWIDSPEGAYTADPTLTGQAKFGFTSKYKKGANIPTGQTQFQYKVGNLNFHSTAYQWLVVAGARAQFKGDGTINGMGNYGFMLTAIDGSVNGGGGEDKFRIKIWDKDASDQIVYDNMLDAPDDAEITTTVIGGGQIVIHK